jgi:hypothetical protein
MAACGPSAIQPTSEGSRLPQKEHFLDVIAAEDLLLIG